MPAWLLVLTVAAALQSVGDAETLWGTGRRSEALEQMASELERRPQDATLRRLLAERQMEVQRFAAALETAAPLGPELDGLRGQALYLLARYDEALQHLQPGDPLQSLMIVDSLMALGRGAEAEVALTDASRVLGADHPRVLTLRARGLAEAGRHAEAVPVFRQALAADGLDREALFGLGRALVRSGQREEGLAVLERHRQIVPLLDQRDFAIQSLALEPLHADSHAALGDVERELGLLDSAEQRYLRAAELAAADGLVPIALRHARLLAEDRDDLHQALARLDEADRRAPDARLRVRAGDLLAGSGSWAEALARYERALLLRPDEPQIQRRIEEARAQLSEPERP
jgi:tetratricopeptide (TPR) repeat protein